MQLEKAFYAFFRITVRVWIRVILHSLCVTVPSLAILRILIYFGVYHESYKLDQTAMILNIL